MSMEREAYRRANGFWGGISVVSFCSGVGPYLA